MADFEYVLSSGVIVPDTADIRAEVEAEYRQIFGDDFVTDPETPEGALITAETNSRIAVARNNAQLANQINPSQAGGTFLDAIWALTNGQRTQQSRSTVQIVNTGVAGTVVPAGSRIQTAERQIWTAASAFTIPASGTIAASFQAEEFGPITASPNTINQILDDVLGWETVNNTAAATPGQLTESDTQARRRRRNQLALQGRSTAEAIRSNLDAVTGVRSFQFRENVTDTTQVIDGITLVPHSIWSAVDGGIDTDIGSALLEAKSGGANWNGATTVGVTDPSSGQTFTVRFDRPTPVAISVRVTARTQLGNVPSSDIVQAVLDYANGLVEGEDGFTVGTDVSPFEIGAAVNAQIPGTFVVKVEVAEGTENPNFVTDLLDIELDEIATVAAGNIEVIQQ